MPCQKHHHKACHPPRPKPPSCNHHDHIHPRTKNPPLPPPHSPYPSPSPATTSSPVPTCSNLVGIDSYFLTHPTTIGKKFNISVARIYTGSNRKKKCVVKWVRSAHKCSHHGHPKNIVTMANIAASCAKDFNKDFKGECNWKVVVNVPNIVRSDEEERCRLILAEPYLVGFKTFNSKSGRVVNDTHRTATKFVNALSHFSYAWSKGRFIISDLQGGVDEEEKIITLVDPSIQSTSKGFYECTDGGIDGIHKFFERHVCSTFCQHLPGPRDDKVL